MTAPRSTSQNRFKDRRIGRPLIIHIFFSGKVPAVAIDANHDVPAQAPRFFCEFQRLVRVHLDVVERGANKEKGRTLRSYCECVHRTNCLKC